MNTTTQTPNSTDEYSAQIEATRHNVEQFVRNVEDAHFDAYEKARQISDLRKMALYAETTEVQEMKMHKDISRMVRHAERLQAEVQRFEKAMKIISERIESKYLQNNYK